MKATPIPQSEGDTNLTSRRAAWQARALDGATRALLAEDERYFLRQSVSTPCLNAIAKAEGIWIEDVGGTALHGFPRQQRAPHRLRPSAPEEGDRRADGGAAVRAAPLRQCTGRGAGEEARRRSRRSGQPRCCSPRAARTPSRWRSRSPAPPRAGSRRCPSGTPSTARASAPARCRARRCSAPARRRHWWRARSTSRLMPARAAPTARRALEASRRRPARA